MHILMQMSTEIIVFKSRLQFLLGMFLRDSARNSHYQFKLGSHFMNKTRRAVAVVICLGHIRKIVICILHYGYFTSLCDILYSLLYLQLDFVNTKSIYIS